jgi:hypothetical protein
MEFDAATMLVEEVMDEIVVEESANIPSGRDLCHRLLYEKGHLKARESWKSQLRRIGRTSESTSQEQLFGQA